jgi:hypothetical protein
VRQYLGQLNKSFVDSLRHQWCNRFVEIKGVYLLLLQLSCLDLTQKLNIPSPARTKGLNPPGANSCVPQMVQQKAGKKRLSNPCAGTGDEQNSRRFFWGGHERR